MFLLSQKSVVGSSGMSSSTSPFGNISAGAIIIAAVVAFIVALVLLVTVAERKKAPRGKFLRWLREYLNFRSILISGLIKFVYLFLAVFLTAMSVVVMCSGEGEMVLPMIGIGFAMMVFGNVLLRIFLEMTMAIIVIWENTSDMRSVMVKDEEKPEEKKPEESKKKEEKKDEPKEEPVVKQEPVIEQQVNVQAKPEIPQTPVAPKPVVEQPGAGRTVDGR